MGVSVMGPVMISTDGMLIEQARVAISRAPATSRTSSVLHVNLRSRMVCPYRYTQPAVRVLRRPVGGALATRLAPAER